MTEKQAQIGRLAMRHEGNFWNAYYAMPETMDGALLLGSIAMAAIKREERKMAFMNLMREVIADLIEANSGIRPTWGGAHQAPERERAGHS